MLFISSGSNLISDYYSGFIRRRCSRTWAHGSRGLSHLKVFVLKTSTNITLQSTFDLHGWIAKHGQEQTRPILDKVVKSLQASGVTKFAAAGYCFGGEFARSPTFILIRWLINSFHKLVMSLIWLLTTLSRLAWLLMRPCWRFRQISRLAFGWILLVYTLSHLAILQKYRDVAKAPLLINSCEFDPPFNLEAQATADKVFKDFAPGYKREHFEGLSHGFTVRGDLSDPKIKEGRERSFKATIEWFAKYL